MAYLEHLCESDREVEVGKVATDQTERVEDAYWNNCSKVYTPGHFNIFPAIKESGGAGQNLGHERCEGKVPPSQEYSCKIILATAEIIG